MVSFSYKKNEGSFFRIVLVLTVEVPGKPKLEEEVAHISFSYNGPQATDEQRNNWAENFMPHFRGYLLHCYEQAFSQVDDKELYSFLEECHKKVSQGVRKNVFLGVDVSIPPAGDCDNLNDALSTSYLYKFERVKNYCPLFEEALASPPPTALEAFQLMNVPFGWGHSLEDFLLLTALPYLYGEAESRYSKREERRKLAFNLRIALALKKSKDKDSSSLKLKDIVLSSHFPYPENFRGYELSTYPLGTKMVQAYLEEVPLKELSSLLEAIKGISSGKKAIELMEIIKKGEEQEGFSYTPEEEDLLALEAYTSYFKRFLAGKGFRYRAADHLAELFQKTDKQAECHRLYRDILEKEVLTDKAELETFRSALYSTSHWCSTKAYSNFVLLNLRKEHSLEEIVQLLQALAEKRTPLTPHQWDLYLQNADTYKGQPPSWWLSLVNKKTS